MIRGAAEQTAYYVKQRVEVRNTHNGHEIWRDARIHKPSSRGCFVVYNDGPQTPQHIMFPDLRPMQPKPREHTPKVTTPLLSAEDIAAYNAKIEEEERQKAAQPPPQNLVLLRRSEPQGEGLQLRERRERTPRKHAPTPLSSLLRNRRAEKGLQQRTLSQRTKMHQSRLSNLEFGDSLPTDEELLELAVALELEYDELIALRSPKPRPEPELESGLRNCAPEPHERILERLPLHAPTLIEDIQEPRKPVAPPPQQQTVDVERLLRQLERLKEENTILRNTVVFYAGLERP